MAIYRLYLEKDTTLYSESATSNTGKDEIIEISGYEDITGTARTSRVLLKPNKQQVLNIINNKANNAPVSASLKLFLAEASEIPVSFTVEAYPLVKTWDEGRGKFGDIPIDTTGATWRYSLNGSQEEWISSSFDTGTTGSYIAGQIGGGLWFYEISGSQALISQSFSDKDDLDISLNITDYINNLSSSLYPDNGLLIKLEDDFEFNTSSNIRLRYFSSDTNTIYSPLVEIKWDDTVFNTGSISPITSDNLDISISNNKGYYFVEEETNIRLRVRPKYPVRTFTTGSVYLTNYYLPTTSYWGIRDYQTGEIVIPFDTNYTKISCDSSGPFFKIYFNALEPERIYTPIIKTEINGNIKIINLDTTFKVIRYAR
jgi:hypothetical protein